MVPSPGRHNPHGTWLGREGLYPKKKMPLFAADAAPHLVHDLEPEYMLDFSPYWAHSQISLHSVQTMQLLIVLIKETGGCSSPDER